MTTLIISDRGAFGHQTQSKQQMRFLSSELLDLIIKPDLAFEKAPKGLRDAKDHSIIGCRPRRGSQPQARRDLQSMARSCVSAREDEVPELCGSLIFINSRGHAGNLTLNRDHSGALFCFVFMKVQDRKKGNVNGIQRIHA